MRKKVTEVVLKLSSVFCIFFSFFGPGKAGVVGGERLAKKRCAEIDILERDSDYNTSIL